MILKCHVCGNEKKSRAETARRRRPKSERWNFCGTDLSPCERRFLSASCVKGAGSGLVKRIACFCVADAGVERCASRFDRPNCASWFLESPRWGARHELPCGVDRRSLDREHGRVLCVLPGANLDVLADRPEFHPVSKAARMDDQEKRERLVRSGWRCPRLPARCKVSGCTALVEYWQNAQKQVTIRDYVGMGPHWVTCSGDYEGQTQKTSERISARLVSRRRTMARHQLDDAERLRGLRKL